MLLQFVAEMGQMGFILSVMVLVMIQGAYLSAKH
jgi:hypothetical protein